MLLLGGLDVVNKVYDFIMQSGDRVSDFSNRSFEPRGDHVGIYGIVMGFLVYFFIIIVSERDEILGLLGFRGFCNIEGYEIFLRFFRFILERYEVFGFYLLSFLFFLIVVSKRNEIFRFLFFLTIKIYYIIIILSFPFIIFFLKISQKFYKMALPFLNFF